MGDGNKQSMIMPCGQCQEREFFLQKMKGFILTEVSEMAHLCPNLCSPMDCSLPGFSIHGIFQARPAFSLSSFTFIKGLFSSSSLSSIRIVSSACQSHRRTYSCASCISQKAVYATQRTGSSARHNFSLQSDLSDTEVLRACVLHACCVVKSCPALCDPMGPSFMNRHWKTSLEFYIDIHAHSTMMNGFMYGNIFEDEERFQRQAVFPKLLCQNAEDFSYSSTSFNRDAVKAGTGRRFLGGLLDHTSYCYTLEVSFYSYIIGGTTAAVPYTEEACILGRRKEKGDINSPYTDSLSPEVGILLSPMGRYNNVEIVVRTGGECPHTLAPTPPHTHDLMVCSTWLPPDHKLLCSTPGHIPHCPRLAHL
ncbi:hypothetical protein FD755_003244 [Muntiacus reevesi]|uniref:Peptidase M14 carboxypeptidase A domain-containing protein n=1 Tax=Muntiacus reevesi TaxID=9886 RepID=A0A5J5N6D7_MUNRE|nr:hypothetical protein FD755_003244 [Muntiacus reevesi]